MISKPTHNSNNTSVFYMLISDKPRWHIYDAHTLQENQVSSMHNIKAA